MSQIGEATQTLGKEEQPHRALNLDLADPRDRLFADYELLERIGGGGMGVVYRARQISLDREVALKIFAYDPFAIEDMLARFRSEARHAGRLQHPNIVPVFEIGTHENLHYFSMGLVRGPTLGRYLKQAPRTHQELARLMRTIAEAVEYAHQVGILHLDLKPGNVMIDERGAAQVADFGLAHRISEAAEGRVLAAGSPAYMAPEQATRAARLTVQTDIWGLGAILFEMLTGTPPYKGKDTPDTMRLRRAQPPDPPRLRDPSIPADLDAICRHCLAQDPAQRYASARELADDLQRFLDGRPVSVREPSSGERVHLWMRRDPRTAALTGVLAITLLGGLAISLGLWRQAEGLRVDAQSTLYEARRQSALEAQSRGDPLLALPPLIDNIDEAEQADSASEAAFDRLRLGALLARMPRQIASIPNLGEGRSVAFAEDGGLLLASLRNGELVAIEVASTRERWRIVPPFPPTAWGNSFAGRILATPDGRHALLHSSGSSGIARPDVSAMHRVRLSDGRLDPLPVAAEAHSYAADGRSALLKTAAGWQRWRLDPWTAEGQPFVHDSLYCQLSLRGMAACAEQGFKRVVLFDAKRGEAWQRVDFSGGAELSAWLPSPDGRWWAFGSSAGEVLLIDMESGVQQRLSDEGPINDLNFDGRWLAVSNNLGSVRVADYAAGRWLTRSQPSGGDRMNAVMLDGRGGWLIGNDGRIVVWPFQHPGAERPAPLAVIRHRGALIGMHAVALDAERGLLASFGSEGEIKLLRLPQQRASGVPWLAGGGERPAPAAEYIDGELRMADGRRYALPAPPYRVEQSRGGRVLLAAGDAVYLATDTLRRIELPHSVQTLRVHPSAEWAVLGWIEAEGPLNMGWRVLDLVSGEWRSPVLPSVGLVDDLRLGEAGFALWQGRHLRVYRDDGQPLGALSLPEADLRIADVALLGTDEVLVATVARSRLQPATLEQWRLGASAERLRRLDTPSAHDRVYALGDTWIGHGARVAVYQGSRREITEFGSDWSEAAALSAELGLAAFATRGQVQIFSTDDWRPLLAPLALPLAQQDGIAEMAFGAAELVVLSHYGLRHVIPLAPERRAIAELRAEATDVLPPREASPPAADRASRDPGLPSATFSSAPPAPTPPYNVAPRQRFQGSHKGLGITDSAGWPQGPLRLRGVDYQLGPAIQLAPPGTALGAAEFPSEAEWPLPAGSKLRLLLGNQLPRDPGFALEWLDAQGAVIQVETYKLPPSWDGAIHDDSRAHRPLAEVALIVRTAESRERGGGSEQLFIYQLSLDRPPQATHLRLRALGAAPLVLGLGVVKGAAIQG